uniref:Transcription factor CBF/NF-Y/archaeal histone domain-containing protein n=1 Tax=Lotharella globosa TaxID=91324 RepID=A0A6V3INM4_9EUKA
MADDSSSQQVIANPDRLLPIANISRIMKQALPANAKVAKEAKDCIQECVTEFIGFITSEASDRLAKDDRKTITGNDIIDSMRALGFNDYLAFLQVFLEKRRKALKGVPAAKRRKKNQSGS